MSEFLVADSTKKDSTFFWHLTLKPCFWNLKQKISPLIVPKNIGDCVPSRDKSIGTPLDPPLFQLDNIFKFTYLSEPGVCIPANVVKALALLGW